VTERGEPGTEGCFGSEADITMASRRTSLPAEEMKMWNISVAPMPSSISRPRLPSTAGGWRPAGLRWR